MTKKRSARNALFATHIFAIRLLQPSIGERDKNTRHRERDVTENSAHFQQPTPGGVPR